MILKINIVKGPAGSCQLDQPEADSWKLRGEAMVWSSKGWYSSSYHGTVQSARAVTSHQQDDTIENTLNIFNNKLPLQAHTD